MPAVVGGAEKFVFMVSHNLYRRGHAVVGVTRAWPNAPKPTAEHPLVIVDAPNTPWVASLMFSRRAAEAVNALRPDAVLVNGYWGESSPLWIKHPTAVIIHDLGLVEVKRVNPVKHRIRVAILKRVIRRADTIVVPTTHVLTQLEVHFSKEIKDKGILLLGGEGVDTNVKPNPVINDQFDIVMVARFAPNKNHLTVLEAFNMIAKALPDAHLWLVGSKPRDRDYEYYRKIIKIVNALNVKHGKRVHVVTDAPDVHKYYDLADVCVSASTGEEGYGLTTVECMLHEKPVIASKIFELTGVATPERAYIVENPEDPHEWAFKIVHVYTNKEEATEKARRGREYALTQSWDAVTGKIEAVLKIISRRRE